MYVKYLRGLFSRNLVNPLLVGSTDHLIEERGGRITPFGAPFNSLLFGWNLRRRRRRLSAKGDIFPHYFETGSWGGNNSSADYPIFHFLRFSLLFFFKVVFTRICGKSWQERNCVFESESGRKKKNPLQLYGEHKCRQREKNKERERKTRKSIFVFLPIDEIDRSEVVRRKEMSK